MTMPTRPSHSSADQSGYQPLARLPQSPQPQSGRRTSEVFAALGAGAALIVLVAGVPAALVVFIGNPLPTTAPGREWLTAQISTTVLLRVLAVVVWALWAHFVVCVLSEWRSMRRGRLPAAVPLGGSNQLLARRLVAALLLLGSAVALAVPSTQTVAPRAPAVVSVQLDAVPGPAVHEDATGQEADDSAQAQAPLKYYEVRPPHRRHHDCLWDISERTLGDPLRYKEILHLNEGRVQPDGRRLVDADLIHPGWILVLPADASGPGVTVVAPIKVPAAPTSTGDQAGGQAGDQTGGQAGSGVSGGSSIQQGDTAQESYLDRVGMPRVMLGGGLLLAGLLVALTARRGPFGDPDAKDERLRLAATPQRSELLDRALRQLARARAEQGLPLPEALMVALSEDTVVVYVTAGAHTPPAPWVADEAARSWTVRAADLSETVEGPRAAAPYPLLANIAEIGGYEILVDLEAAPGLVALGGDPHVAREIATSLAVELATNAWSDGVRVTMVGFADELSGLAPTSIRQVDAMQTLLPQIEADLGGHAALIARLGVDGVLAGRTVRGERPWTPHVVVLSGPLPDDETARLQAMIGNGRTPLAVICVGDTPAARWRFTAAQDGAVHLGILGLSGAARRLPPQEYTEVLELLRAADTRRQRHDLEVAALSPQGAAQGSGGDRSDPGGGVLPVPARPAGPAAVEVHLLGPVRVEVAGSTAAPDPDRVALLTEVVVVAALHRGGLHDAALRAAVWPRGVGDDVVQRTVADVAAWLGSGSDGVPRLHRADDGRWMLAPDVRTDWDVFRMIAGAPPGPGEAHQLRQALSLGTGEVFSQIPAGRYGWLAFHQTARDARVLTTTVSRRLASLALAAGQRQEASQALNQGLDMVPTAEPLWRDLLRLVGGDDPATAAATAERMYAVLLGHGVRLPEPETDALVDAVAPGLRERTA